ncbi:MAG: hypothetical protein LBQ97_06730 [Fusobacteriaceae bacterium]|nr:hypothetical protein [Fusobacteriaceae bacterium]
MEKKEKRDLIEDLMEIMRDKNLTELSYTGGNLSVTLKGSGIPPKEKAAAPAKKETTTEKDKGNPDMGAKVVRSENIGLFFYETPEMPSRIAVGKTIEAGDAIGYIITLGVKNTVKSEYAGTIAEICVANGAPVDYGRILLRIREGE